jgi:hypothetical protein
LLQEEILGNSNPTSPSRSGVSISPSHDFPSEQVVGELIADRIIIKWKRMSINYFPTP